MNSHSRRVQGRTPKISAYADQSDQCPRSLNMRTPSSRRRNATTSETVKATGRDKARWTASHLLASSRAGAAGSTWPRIPTQEGFREEPQKYRPIPIRLINAHAASICVHQAQDEGMQRLRRQSKRQGETKHAGLLVISSRLLVLVRRVQPGQEFPLKKASGKNPKNIGLSRSG